MQIILMEKVVNLGSLGDLVKVKDGYARNFLIPQGKAKGATLAAKQEFEERPVEFEITAAEKLVGVLVSISRMAGVDGLLFGAVSNHDVADGLKALGFNVEKSDIRMPMGPLKTVGESSLEVSQIGRASC